MPFFIQPEAGSGVSELLDERLRKLKLELEESEKACQALLPSVEAFTKGTREMCRGAGNAASAFGAAIEVDSARREGAECLQHRPAAHDYLHGGTRDGDGYAGKRGDGNSTEAGGGETPEMGSRRSSGNDGSSGESMRAELMALQLIECAHEMEDHLKAQVVEPIEHVLARRSNINAAIRERSRVADLLAAAHSDYARAVARYQSSSADNVNGGPPLEVLRSGDRVVGASDAFAEAHGRAEEALIGLLEERGQCLRKAGSALKAAQAGFFVRASRCVSSSVGRESTDSASARTAGDQKVVVASKTGFSEASHEARARCAVDSGASTPQDNSHTTPSPGKDNKGTTVASGEAKPEAAALEIESGSGGGTVDGSSDQARSPALTMAIEDRNKVKGKWRKGGDREAIRSDTAKRRRSSGWFKRLTSSFQTSRPRSASEEFRDRMPSPLHEVADGDSGGDDDRKLWFRSTAPATMSSLQSSTDRFLFREDVPDAGASLRNGRDAGPRPAGNAKSSGAVAEEYAARSIGQSTREDQSFTARAGGDESLEEHAAAEEEDSDYETGSNTTEGFGSDDAGDLWEGRRSTLMGLLGQSSPMPNKSGHPAEAVAAEGNNEKVDSESNGGIVASGSALPREDVNAEETVVTPMGHKEIVPPPPALMGQEEMTGMTADFASLYVANPDVTLPAMGAESALSGTDGDDGVYKECNGDGGDVTDVTDLTDVNDHSRILASDGEGSKVEGFSSPAPAARSSHFATVSPLPAPPSLLSASPEPDTGIGEKEDADHLPPVVVEQHVPEAFSKLDSSPVISDASSNKESPRAWRLSWWARASDRHPPPPPNGREDNEEAGGGVDKSVAAALTAATGGQEAVAAVLSAGGAFAPSCSAGDRPAVVDGGATTATSPEKASESSAASPKMAAAERRSKRRSRRRREKPWLSKDKLTEAQTRPLEAALEYLDVAALARAGMVCCAWREPLSGDEGRWRWLRCVRLADGVPEKWRAKFYLHVLYDQPSWVGKAHGSSSSEHPRAGVYQDCLAKADADQEETEAAKKIRSTLEEEERDGRTPPRLEARDDRLPDSSASQELGTSRGEDMLPATPKYHKWLDEIETDVLRTCPDDDTNTSVDDAVKEFDSAISKQISARAAPGSREIGDSTFDTSAVSGSSRVRFREVSFGSTSGAVDSVDDSNTAVVEDAASAAPGEGAVSVEEVKEAVRRPSALAVSPGGATGVPAGSDGVGARGKRRFSVAGGGTRDKLRRVLRAFAVYNRRVSYCQGMNFVALALLEACEGDDENAFWILAGMCENLELEGLWCQGLERLDLCFFSLARLLHRHCPSLRQHLADEGVELSMFTSRWFVTLFTSTDVFGRGTSRKILDMFLVEGWPLLFKMSLGVLLEMRPLLEPADMEGILKVTKFPRAHLFGLRRDGSGRNIAGASFEEATQGSLCESIRAGQMVEHALLLHISEETLEQHLQEYHLQKHAEPGSD